MDRLFYAQLSAVRSLLNSRIRYGVPMCSLRRGDYYNGMNEICLMIIIMPAFNFLAILGI